MATNKKKASDVEKIENDELEDMRSKCASKSSYQDITACSVVLERLTLETRNKKRASESIDVKMEESINSLESGKIRSKGASRSADVEMKENVCSRKCRSKRSSRSTNVETNERTRDRSKSAPEPVDALMEEIIKNVESGKMTEDEVCEILRKENEKLVEFYESELKRNKELVEEQRQLEEIIKVTCSQAKLIARTDFLQEQQDHVVEQSALLDKLHKKICYYIRNFLDDGLSNGNSSFLNKQSTNILHLLIPNLTTGKISAEEIILKTDPSMSEAINFLISINIIEQLPDDPTCVRLCKETFLDIH